MAKTKQRVPKGHPKKLKLEVGKRYLSKKGRRVFIQCARNARFESGPAVWNEDGTVWIPNGNTARDYGDLICEYKPKRAKPVKSKLSVPARSKKAKQGKPGRGRG